MRVVVDSVNIKKESERVDISFNDYHFEDKLKGELNLSILGGQLGKTYINAKQSVTIENVSSKLIAKLTSVLNEIEAELNENK